jgi:hypothetical protein
LLPSGYGDRLWDLVRGGRPAFVYKLRHGNPVAAPSTPKSAGRCVMPSARLIALAKIVWCLWLVLTLRWH